MQLLLAITVGAAIALVFWSATRLVVEVPAEDRSFLDRPPLGFRLVWPWIKWVTHYGRPLMGEQVRVKTLAKLRKAGADYMLSAEQFLAGRLTAGLIAAALAAALYPALGWEFTVHSLELLAVIALAGSYYPQVWLSERTRSRERAIFRSLPFYLDIITLSVEAGTNITGAFTQAVQRGPEGPLKSEFSRFLRDVRAGKTRSDAMRAMADRMQMEAVTSFVSSLIQAERMGSSLGSVLRAQADQRRTERFLKAEKMAMEAPVKLLGPLIMFIFPTTFMVLTWVLVFKAVAAGVLNWSPLVRALSWPQ